MMHPQTEKDLVKLLTILDKKAKIIFTVISGRFT